MRIKQNRLWLIVTPLILIIVVLASALGWQILQNRKDTNTTNEVAAATAQGTPPNGRPGYLFINEWGVKIPVDDEVGPMYYTMDKNIAFIRSEKLDTAGEKDCTTNTIYVTRGFASDKVPQEEKGPTKTFVEVYDSTSVEELTLNIRSIKVKIDDYYYVAPLFSGSSCVKTSDHHHEDGVHHHEDEVHDQELLNKQIAESKAAVAVVHAVNKLIPQ